MSKSDNEKNIKVFTIGYAGKNARQFFSILKQTGVKKVIDVRLYNTSQLAGFTKKQDLRYFLDAIVCAEYIHMPIMAPTKQLLNDYKKGLVSWKQYETQFKSIITERQIEKHIIPQDMNMACFLCSEATADNCHRRLVSEYLAKHLQNVSIVHL
ncbi:MAG: DUF488 domain-containing protein [Phycisphaerae bacterium]|nr:DUF488 domain-containing protein [Bacteroidota bacterium]MBL7107433.1 DUF488 domain-containing protein [Phycisphaerae bacterium]